ncbi:hypothetical protein Tco_0185479 [Tanacetum coccineum]
MDVTRTYLVVMVSLYRRSYNEIGVDCPDGVHVLYGGSGVLGAGVLGVLGQAWEGGKADGIGYNRGNRDYFLDTLPWSASAYAVSVMCACNGHTCTLQNTKGCLLGNCLVLGGIALAMNIRMASILATGENDSSKSIPTSCRYPLATNQALFFSTPPHSVFSYTWRSLQFDQIHEYMGHGTKFPYFAVFLDLCTLSLHLHQSGGFEHCFLLSFWFKLSEKRHQDKPTLHQSDLLSGGDLNGNV